MPNHLQHITDALSEIYPPDECRAIARTLLAELMGVSNYFFGTDKSTELNEEQTQKLQDILHRLRCGCPLQYALGTTEFFGRTFRCDHRALIPRPETEELVEWIIATEPHSSLRILDIGTGSGCIAISLKKAFPHAEVWAWDISPEALALAQENAGWLDANIQFQQVDVLSNLTEESVQFDIIVSNPPYITHAEKNDMHTNVLQFEPHTALFVDDSDPLMFYRRIAKIATNRLVNGGRLYFETNARFGKQVAQMLTNFGYQNVELRQDLSGNDRMTKAHLPTP